MHLCLNPHITIRPFDSNTSAALVICEIPTVQDGRPNRVVFRASLRDFLVLFDGNISTDRVVAAYISQQSPFVQPEGLRKLAEGYLREKAILIPAHRTYDPPEPIASRRRYITVSCTLCPERLTRVLAYPFSWLFTPIVMALFSVVFVCTQIFYFAVYFPLFHFNISNITGGEFATILALTTLSGLIHELGHASALAHYGSRRASIGWCIYIIWSAFYTDLSDAWILTRRQRVVVDCGGMYFQAISQCILIYLIGTTHSRALFYTCYAVDLQMLGCLNPLLRTDAYWIFSDLFGISDLRDRTYRALTELFKKQPIASTAQEQGSISMKLAIRIYTFILMPVFIVLPGISVVQVALVILPGFPSTTLHCIQLFQTHPLHPILIASSLLQLLCRLLSIVGVLFLAKRLFQLVKRRLSTLQLPSIRKPA